MMCLDCFEYEQRWLPEMITFPPLPARSGPSLSDANLLTIPPEIRSQIYGYLVHRKTFRNSKHNFKLRGVHSSLSILLTCRRINIEATKLIYEHNTFRICLPFDGLCTQPPLTRTAAFIQNLDFSMDTQNYASASRPQIETLIRLFEARFPAETPADRSRRMCYITFKDSELIW